MPSRISAYVMALIRKRVCARCAQNHSSTSGSGRGRINSDRTLVSIRMRAPVTGCSIWENGETPASEALAAHRPRSPRIGAVCSSANQGGHTDSMNP